MAEVRCLDADGDSIGLWWHAIADMTLGQQLGTAGRRVGMWRRVWV